jgi:hypothetical protein
MPTNPNPNSPNPNSNSGTIILPSTRSVTTLSPVLLLQLPAYAAG